MLVADGRGCPRLAEEAAAGLRDVGHCRRQDLERDNAVERGINCPKDFAHAAPADSLDYLVGADPPRRFRRLV